MDRFVNSILPHVPGCPKALIKNEVLGVAIDFCQDSFIWQLDEEHTLAASADEITLTVGTGEAVAGCQISIDGGAINEYSRSAATVTLDDAVTTSTTFQTTTFLKPDRAATSLPDILYNDWFSAIEAGAMASLMLMPGKDWTNPKLGLIHQRNYLIGLGQAKMKTRKRNDQTRLRVMSRGFV